MNFLLFLIFSFLCLLLPRTQKRKKKKEKEEAVVEAVKEAVAYMERLMLGPTKLWTGLVLHQRLVPGKNTTKKRNVRDAL